VILSASPHEHARARFTEALVGLAIVDVGLIVLLGAIPFQLRTAHRDRRYAMNHPRDHDTMTSQQTEGVAAPRRASKMNAGPKPALALRLDLFVQAARRKR
jgi:hypothetical protein